MVSIISLSILSFISLSSFVFAADIEQIWVLKYKIVRPDGVEKRVPVINGQFPGPELRGKAGQSVRIVLKNQLDSESTSIHWHGIKQVGTVWSDGVPGITQCPIEPNEDFVYEFNLDGPGTLWWHSHSNFQKSSIYGVIIIEGDNHIVPFYDEDKTLLLNDWFHLDPAIVAQNLLNRIPDFIPPSFDSLLLNGRGIYNCSLNPQKDCDLSHPNTGPFILNVEPGKTYRLRIVGASSDSFINIGFEKHQMKVIETETTLLQPYSTRYIDVHAGQTYSALFRTKTLEELSRVKNNNGLFWIQLNTQPFEQSLSTYAILRYSTAAPGDSIPLRKIPKWNIQNKPRWSIRQARRQKALQRTGMPLRADRIFTTTSTVNIQPDGLVNFAVNNISFVQPDTPVLQAVKFKNKKETRKYIAQTAIPFPFDYSKSFQELGLSTASLNGTQVIKVRKNEVIDMIFQNVPLAFPGSPTLTHPWHLHLHNFWVLGYGPQDGSAWTPADQRKYELRRPVSRNTFTLFTLSWTAIRVKFDNPGVAFMHCHINPHLFMGMAWTIQIGKRREIPDPPRGTKFCGIQRRT